MGSSLGVAGAENKARSTLQKNSPANLTRKHTEKYYYALIIIMVPSIHYSVPPFFKSPMQLSIRYSVHVYSSVNAATTTVANPANP